jgi:hypothetical protein
MPRIRVHTRFLLNLGGGLTKPFCKGVHEVTQEEADHWYTKQHAGIVADTEPVENEGLIYTTMEGWRERTDLDDCVSDPVTHQWRPRSDIPVIDHSQAIAKAAEEKERRRVAKLQEKAQIWEESAAAYRRESVPAAGQAKASLRPSRHD